jgi:hypothetical protein
LRGKQIQKSKSSLIVRRIHRFSLSGIKTSRIQPQNRHSRQWRRGIEKVATGSESVTYSSTRKSSAQSSDWIKVGVVATLSVLAGERAAAWWYRKTLKTLRETGETPPNPQFGIDSVQPDQRSKHPMTII